MDGPWFRKWFLISRVPITWQGWVCTVSVWLGSYALVPIAMNHREPILSTIATIAWFVILIGFFILVEWKLERDYSG
jgi:hypothetical protein